MDPTIYAAAAGRRASANGLSACHGPEHACMESQLFSRPEASSLKPEAGSRRSPPGRWPSFDQGSGTTSTSRLRRMGRCLMPRRVAVLRLTRRPGVPALNSDSDLREALHPRFVFDHVRRCPGWERGLGFVTVADSRRAHLDERRQHVPVGQRHQRERRMR